ncbi:MAG: pilin [Gammaproteobacteria bacterium]|nr:MAG: pilin [Gammaproteobacteria bacterium]
MKLQKKVQQGFTLIELMIVIAIVGILAAIALPAYQDYIVRSKLSEALGALAESKTTIAEYVAANGTYPTDATSFGLNTIAIRPGSEILKFISIATPTVNQSVRVVANVYTTVWDGGTWTSSVGTLAFHLSGSTHSDGTMSWDCIPGDDGKINKIKTKYLPANCRG